MNRIPVGRTIAQSYAFVFRHYFSLLGIVWLPFALLGAANFLILMPVFKDFAAALPRPGHPELAFVQMHKMPLVWLVNLLVLAFVAIVLVGATREALGVPRKTSFIYLRLTLDELRAAGAIFFLFVMLYVVAIAVVVIGAVLGGVVVAVLAASGGTEGTLDTGVAMAEVVGIIGVVAAAIGTAVLYVGIRLSFVFLPVTVVEKRFGIWRSWDLMRGNFWRALAVGFVAGIPILIIDGATFWFSTGPSFLAMIRHFGDQHAMMEQMQILRSHMLSTWAAMPYLWAAGLVTAPIIYGLAAASGVFAYRALTAAENATTPPV